MDRYRSPSPVVLLPVVDDVEEEIVHKTKKPKKRKRVVDEDDEKAPAVDLAQIDSDVRETMARALDDPVEQVLPEEKPKKLPKWRPLALELNPFDGKDFLEPEYSPAHPEYNDHCFFCYCQMTRSDLVENPRYKGLYSFYTRNWGRVNPIWLMNRGQDLYNSTVRRHTKRNWPFFRRNAYEHFLSHDLTPRFVLEFQESCFRTIMRQMVRSGNLFEQNIEDPSRVRCKSGALKVFKEIAQYHRTVHSEVVACRMST